MKAVSALGVYSESSFPGVWLQTAQLMSDLADVENVLAQSMMALTDPDRREALFVVATDRRPICSTTFRPNDVVFSLSIDPPTFACLWSPPQRSITYP